jgi:putative acetyltransferase
VRLERPEDSAAIRRVHEAAFAQPDEADLVDALREAGDLVPELCLVTERDGAVIGHIAFSGCRRTGRRRAGPCATRTRSAS